MVILVTGYCAAMAVLAATAREPTDGNSDAVEADRPEETTSSQQAHRKST